MSTWYVKRKKDGKILPLVGMKGNEICVVETMPTYIGIPPNQKVKNMTYELWYKRSYYEPYVKDRGILKRQHNESISYAILKLVQNKGLIMAKASYYVQSAVITLKAKNIKITNKALYNCALGQGGWSK